MAWVPRRRVRGRRRWAPGPPAPRAPRRLPAPFPSPRLGVLSSSCPWRCSTLAISQLLGSSAASCPLSIRVLAVLSSVIRAALPPFPPVTPRHLRGSTCSEAALAPRARDSFSGFLPSYCAPPSACFPFRLRRLKPNFDDASSLEGLGRPAAARLPRPFSPVSSRALSMVTEAPPAVPAVWGLSASLLGSGFFSRLVRLPPPWPPSALTCTFKS